MSTKPEKSALPWERVTREGYAVLDLRLDASATETPRVYDIRRNRPNVENPGAFVVYFNDAPISEKHWLQRPDAIAEAERHFYDTPEFAASGNAKLVNAAVIQGREAQQAGASIYQNPFPATPETNVDRSLWVQGYMEAAASQIADKAIAAAVATARANAQLESDLLYMNAAYRQCKLAINYACNFPNAIDGIGFIREWATSNDEQAFYAKFPGWKEYRDADPKTKPAS